MEGAAKEDPVPCKKPLFLDKAGWVKKDTGRLLPNYKDRYIQVEKTEVVIYENEDLKNCLETLNLEKYDRCHEIKSALRKKHRLILIRSPKAEKVHDVRFQTQTTEEKEAWIRALSNGISRAKNKVFDEVKIDESCNLEHFTRSRPKGNRNRRPPTRIHLKEVAGMSNDDILHMDLGRENTPMSNGTQSANNGIETSKEAPQLPYSLSGSRETKEKEFKTSTDGLHTEPVVCPQKKVLKPPMPPTKETKPTTHELEPEKESCPTKKALNIPMPPLKEAKLCIAPIEEATEKTKIEEKPMDCDDSRKNTSQVRANGFSENSQPPIPPSQEKKPSHANKVSDQVNFGITENVKEAESSVQCEKSKSFATGDDSRELSEEVGHSMTESAGDLCPKHPGLVVLPKKKQEKPQVAGRQNDLDTPTEKPDPASLIPTATDLSDSVCQAEESLSKNEVPSLVVSLSQLDDDGLNASICGVDEGNKTKAEEKSVDSGQHSDDDSDGSRSEDTLAVSTSAMRGSHAGLDTMDSSEENIQSLCYSGEFSGTQASTSKSALEKEVHPCQSSDPDPQGKTSAKGKSASFGDLLSDCAVCFEARWHVGAVVGKDDPNCYDVRKLEAEILMEMEKTTELLNRASQSQRGADGEDDGDDIPGSLLTKAMEKLKKAEYVLREAKRLKYAKTSTNRKSW